MSKDPAFLFYSKDWIEGTAELTKAEKGLFIDLLAHQHQKKSLPSEISRLALIAGMSENEFLLLWKGIEAKFERTLEHSLERLLNRKLEAVMNERAEKSGTNKIIGTFGAVLRLAKLPKQQYLAVKSAFCVSDFINEPSERLTERLTEWLHIRLKSIEDGNENINEDSFEEKKESEKKKKLLPQSKIIPPELEWVKAYAETRKKEVNSDIDPEQFFDHYAARDWIVGRQKMKDWQAAFRTWEKNNFNQNHNGTGTGSGLRTGNSGGIRTPNGKQHLGRQDERLRMPTKEDYEAGGHLGARLAEHRLAKDSGDH